VGYFSEGARLQGRFVVEWGDRFFRLPSLESLPRFGGGLGVG